jgi:hypothetical protein
MNKQAFKNGVLLRYASQNSFQCTKSTTQSILLACLELHSFLKSLDHKELHFLKTYSKKLFYNKRLNNYVYN